MTRELRVVEIETGEIVRSIPVTGDKPEHTVEKTISGLLRNMDTDRFRVEDSADDQPPPARTKSGLYRKVAPHGR